MSKLRSLHWWRTVFFLIPAISLYTIVLGTISVLSTLVDRSGDFGHRCARAWSWLILKTTGVTVQVEGIERLDPARSYVFAANHQSIYDIPIVFSSLPFQLRIIAKQSLGRIPFMGWHLQRTGARAGRSHQGGRRHGAEDGEARGRRPLADRLSGRDAQHSTAASRRFKGGPFAIALDAGLPIVPISIAGSRHVMFRGEVTVHPAATVTLVVHAPIETVAIPREEVREFAAAVRDVVAAGAA